MTNGLRVSVSLLASLLFLYGGNLIAGNAAPKGGNFPKPELFEPDVAVLLFVGSFKFDPDKTKLFAPDSLVITERHKVDLNKLTSYKLKFILIRPNRDKMHTNPGGSRDSNNELFDAGSSIAIFQDVNPYPQPAKPGKGTGKMKDLTQIAEGGGWFFSPNLTQAVNNAIQKALHKNQVQAQIRALNESPSTLLGEANSSRAFISAQALAATPPPDIRNAILNTPEVAQKPPPSPPTQEFSPSTRILCATLDLDKPPFTNNPYSPFITEHGRDASDPNLDAIYLAQNDNYDPKTDIYDTAARWVLAYYAANSNASNASAGEAGAAAFLWKSYPKFDKYGNPTGIVYTMEYAGIPQKNGNITSITSVVPDADFQSLADFISTSLFGSTTPLKLSGAGSLPAPYKDTDTSAAADDAKDMADMKSVSVDTSSSNSGGFPYKFSNLGLPPKYSTDNTGMEIGDNIKFTRRSNNDLLPKSITVSGDGYINRPYYDFTLEPSWSASSFNVNPSYMLSRMPQGVNTLWTQQGQVKASGSTTEFIPQFKCTGNLNFSFNEQRNDATGKSFVDTEDYRGTAQFTETSTLYSSATWLNSMTFGQWLEGDHSTQAGDNFAPAAASAEYTGDIECPWSKQELVQYDLLLSGGGIVGESPGALRIYGGNTAGTTSLGIPGPVLHSFGYGKLGVYPSGSGTLTGATSYGSINAYAAVPVGLFVPIFTRGTGNAIAKALLDPDAGLGDDSFQNENQVHYFTQSEKNLELRPVAIFDAVWMGAPAGYDDRTTLATGGGAELSFYGFNMDYVYALTIHDTAKARQPLGANPMFQMSYDLHF